MKKDEEIQKLSQEFKKARQCEGKIIFPSQLKERVLSLLGEGYSISTLCKQLNLTSPQVSAWKSQIKQTGKADTKLPYEIKTIPIVPSVPEPKISYLKQSNQIRPKMFFRFLSLKISLG